jgi:hypothetical protein
MKGKYQNLMAERLHTRFDPDEEVGRTDEKGWAGMYVSGDRANGGAIIEEDSLGFVSIDVYKTDADLNLAWEDRMSKLEESPEPSPDDYVIQDLGRQGYGVTPLGRCILDMDEAYLAIADEMEATNVFPNVWIVSDHGNFHLVEDFQAEVKRLRDEPPSE